MRFLLIIVLLSSFSFAQFIGGKGFAGGKAGFGGGASASANPALDAMSATNCRTTSVTSQTCSLTVTNGDQILVGVYVFAPSTPSLSGTAGKCDGIYTLSTAASTSIFYATSTATGTGSCTITLSNVSSTTLGLLAISVKNTSGIDVRAPATSLTVDGFKGAGTCPATNTFTFPGVTTTVNNDYVVGLAIDSDTNQGVFSACDGSWTALVNSTLPTMGFEAATQAAAGSSTPGVAVFSTSATINVVTVAYKP